MKWNLEEEKDLINLITKCKEQALPLNYAFKFHSKRYSRSENSVKKHYYSLNPKGSKQKLKEALLATLPKANVVNIKEYTKKTLSQKDFEALFKGLVRLIQESIRCD